MIMPIVLATTLGLHPVACPAPTPRGLPGASDSTWQTVYARGVSFVDFLAAADARHDQWRANYEAATVPADLLARARTVPGHWRLLVVAEDWCSDSVNTIPWLARLVERVNGLEMRVVTSEPGEAIMDAHRTPDGRQATPTVVLLDAHYREVGCFIERPEMLQDWFLANRDRLPREQLLRDKQAWYDEDLGRSTLTAFTDLLEAAGQGHTGCD